MAGIVLPALTLDNVDLTIDLGKNPKEEVKIGRNTYPNGAKVHINFELILALYFLEEGGQPSVPYHPTFEGEPFATNTPVTLTAFRALGAPAEFTWKDASGKPQSAGFQFRIPSAIQLPTPPALHLWEVKLIIRLSEVYEEVEIHGKKYRNNSEVSITRDAAWNVVGYRKDKSSDTWSPAFDGAKDVNHAWVTLAEVETGGLDFSWHNAINPREVFVVRYERNKRIDV